MNNFKKNYSSEIIRVIGKMRKIDEVIKAIDGVNDKYASSRSTMKAAMWHADKKGAIVEKNSLQYTACQTIAWLNSRARVEEGEYFLQRIYGFGDIKISAPKNPEADQMMRDFLVMAGYDAEAFYFLNRDGIYSL